MNKQHKDKNRTANGDNTERGTGAQDPRENNAGQMAGNQSGNGQQQDPGRQERQGERDYERQNGE